MIYLNCSLTTAIVTMADKLCSKARETGRLISVNNTKKEGLLIELPDLECDTTVSCDNVTTTLFDLIKRMDSEDLNVLITGLGGCGKSFSLLSVATKILQPYMNACENNSLLENDVGAIPIYIQLNSILSSASGIEDYIIKQFADFHFVSYKDAESQLLEWKKSLANNKNSQYILLMLDGWNEIVSKDDQITILSEIQKLQGNNAYRMIITSRYNLSRTFSSSMGTVTTKFASFKMNDLEDEVIIDYVKRFLTENGKNENKLNENEINEIIRDKLKEQNGKIKDIYRKPMGLVMFCAIHSHINLGDTEDFFSEINTLGELLHDFMFCIKNAYNSGDIEIYENFLCYFGYRMNIDGVFTVREAVFERYCTDFINEYNYNNQVTIDDIKNSRLVNDVTKRQNTGVSQISFNHQNYRDYFAALFLKKIISLGNASEINEKTKSDRKIPYEVLTILSELMREYKYVDVSGKENNEGIQGVLNLIGSDLKAPTVALLIKVAVIGRKSDLSMFLFENLDLTLTHLNNVVLFRKEEDNIICAEFNEECTISQATFAPTGHAGAPQAILYLEDRYILTFAKNGLCCLDLNIGFSNMVAHYSSNAILSAVHIPDSNKIVTGDARGNLCLWEYMIENNDFRISMKQSYNINNIDNSMQETAVHDIVLLGNKIIFALKNGRAFSANYSLKEISLIIDLYEHKDSSCKYCRLEVIGDTLYIAYGRKIFRKDDGRCLLICNIEHSDGYIYDISRVKDRSCSAILINYRNKKINNSDFSVVYMFNFITNDISELKKIEHTKTSQGFKGWNRFSEPFNHGRDVYLTANINDAPEEAGFYLLSFEAVWDFDKNCKILRCVRNAEECFGNSHIMSVERALFFKYNTHKYVATTSIDRCVEILDVSGTEANLIYHIDGHTNGIPCIDVINENTIYTSHYSGEVCMWTKSNNNWKCETIVKAHSNEWVWVIKHARQANIDYIIAGSYDHNISITNAKSGRCSIMYGCKGRVKSLDLLNESSVVAAYDYKMNNENKFVVHVFKNIDFTTGIAENIVIYNSPAYIQCMCTDEANLYFVVNQNSRSNVYCINKNKLVNDDDNMEIFSGIYHKIGELDNSRNNSKMRSIDVMQIDNDMKLFACGGDIDTLYAEVWLENGKKAVIDSRPVSITEINRKYDSDDGISSIKLAKHNGTIYLIFGSNDFYLYTYRISIDNGEVSLEYLSAVNNDGKVLNVQYTENTGLVYVSLLSGQVITYPINSLINNSAIIPEVLFQASTGMHIINVNLEDCKQIDISDNFKQIINYYGEI